MKHLYQKTILLCIFLLIVSLPTASAYHTIYHRPTKYYGSNYPQSYSLLTRDNFVNYRQYGSNYGRSYSGLYQEPYVVKSAYGSRYPQSYSQLNYPVKNAYGSHYGHSFSGLAQPYYYGYVDDGRNFYDGRYMVSRDFDVRSGFYDVGYVTYDGDSRYNLYHPRYIG